jgi:hypothetical protein
MDAASMNDYAGDGGEPKKVYTHWIEKQQDSNRPPPERPIKIAIQ